jgi:hypothetical protein
MRVAAGVLLLVVAASNLLGGCTYAVGGGLMGGAGAGLGKFTGELAKRQEATVEQKMEAAEVAAAITDVSLAMGGVIVLWGAFLLVLAGLEIAAGVQLFRSKGAMFIIIIAALEILSGVVTMAMDLGFIFALLGMVAAIFAIVAARGFPGSPPPVAEPSLRDTA